MRVFRVYGTLLSITEIWGQQCIWRYVAVRVTVLMTKVAGTYYAKLFSVSGASLPSGMYVAARWLFGWTRGEGISCVLCTGYYF